MTSFDRTAPLILTGNERTYTLKTDRRAVLFVRPGGRDYSVRLYEKVPGTDTATFRRTLLRKNLAGALVETGRYVTRDQRNCGHADVDCQGTCYDCGMVHAAPSVAHYL